MKSTTQQGNFLNYLLPLLLLQLAASDVVEFEPVSSHQLGPQCPPDSPREIRSDWDCRRTLVHHRSTPRTWHWYNGIQAQWQKKGRWAPRLCSNGVWHFTFIPFITTQPHNTSVNNSVQDMSQLSLTLKLQPMGYHHNHNHHFWLAPLRVETTSVPLLRILSQSISLKQRFCMLYNVHGIPTTSCSRLNWLSVDFWLHVKHLYSHSLSWGIEMGELSSSSSSSSSRVYPNYALGDSANLHN